MDGWPVHREAVRRDAIGVGAETVRDFRGTFVIEPVDHQHERIGAPRELRVVRGQPEPE